MKKIASFLLLCLLLLNTSCSKNHIIHKESESKIHKKPLSSYHSNSENTDEAINTISESISQSTDEEPVDVDFDRLTVQSFTYYVEQNSLPPLEEPTLNPPGSLTPVAQLRRAPQELLGKTITLDLSSKGQGNVVLVFSPESGKTLILSEYSYVQTWNRQRNALLVLQTPHRTTQDLLSHFDCLSGTVEQVAIPCGNEHTYAAAQLWSEDSEPLSDAPFVCIAHRADTDTFFHVLTAENQESLPPIFPQIFERHQIAW